MQLLQNLFLQQEGRIDTAEAVTQCSKSDQYIQHLYHIQLGTHKELELDNRTKKKTEEDRAPVIGILKFFEGT